MAVAFTMQATSLRTSCETYAPKQKHVYVFFFTVSAISGVEIRCRSTGHQKNGSRRRREKPPMCCLKNHHAKDYCHVPQRAWRSICYWSLSAKRGRVPQRSLGKAGRRLESAELALMLVWNLGSGSCLIQTAIERNVKRTFVPNLGPAQQEHP